MNDRICKIAEFYFCGALLLAIPLSLVGCGQLYRVKPLPSPVQGGRLESTASSSLGELGIEATALDGDRSLEQFDGNLPMAGVLAVEVHLINRSASELNLATINFALLDGEGGTCPELQPEQALNRVMKFYGNRIYQIEAHRETVESYRRLALPRVGELQAGRAGQGIIFYAIPAQGRLDSGFSFRVMRGGASTSLAIAGGAP